MDDLKKNILVFVLISYITVCYGQGSPVGRILTQMKNVAGKPGQTVTFTAEIDKVNSGNFVVFEFTPPGQQSQTIWQENIPSKINLPVNVPGFTASVGYPKNTNTLKYNYTLTITLPSSLSSIREISVVYSAYFLLYPAFVKTSAYLTVVEPLKCSNSRGQVKQAGTEATLTCSTKYYGYRPPELQWFDNMTTLNTGPPTINATTGMISQTFRRTRVLSSDHNKQFDCVLHYPSTSGDASPPMYNDTCMDSFMVEYTTSTIIIEPRPQNANDVLNLNVGDVFNCTANGNPAPSYHFTCDQGIQITQGNLLKLESQFQRDDQVITCNCVAKQVNKPEKKKQFMFRVYAAGAKAGETAGDGVDAVSSGVVGWHIAVGILVPIIIIAIIVGIVLYCVKIRNKDAKTPPANGGPAAAPEKPAYDNRTFQGSQPNVGDTAKTTAKNAPAPNYANTPEKNGPNYGGTTQQGYPGKGSPGYADLGVRHISGSLPGSTSTINSIPDPSYSQINRDPRGMQGAPPPTQKGTDTSV